MLKNEKRRSAWKKYFLFSQKYKIPVFPVGVVEGIAHLLVEETFFKCCSMFHVKRINGFFCVGDSNLKN